MMNKSNVSNLFVFLVVVAVVAGAAWLKSRRSQPQPAVAPDAPIPAAAQSETPPTQYRIRPEGSRTSQPTAVALTSEPIASAASQPVVGLPRVVDLGADKCKACKALAPILEELKEEYAGRVVVELIDVGKNPESRKRYGIRLIPTQIFYDRAGKEVWRHEGFLPKAEFVAKFAELGVE